MGPLEASKPWSQAGVEGARRFIERVYRLVTDQEYTKRFTKEYDKTLEKIYHQTVKKVTADFEALSFNTGISQLMVFVNEAYKASHIYIGFIEGLVQLISPVTPHVGEELWQILGHNESIAYSKWPTYNEELTKENDVTYAVSVNGKLRDTLSIAINTAKEEVEKIALTSEKVKKYTDGHNIVKIIVVPNKIVNIVIK